MTEKGTPQGGYNKWIEEVGEAIKQVERELQGKPKERC